jgi:hypothetical protein
MSRNRTPLTARTSARILLLQRSPEQAIERPLRGEQLVSRHDSTSITGRHIERVGRFGDAPGGKARTALIGMT